MHTSDHTSQHTSHHSASTEVHRRFAPAAAKPVLSCSTALLVVAALASIGVGTAHAALTTYTSEVAWQGSVVMPGLISFDDLADGTTVSNQYPGIGFSSFNGGKPTAAAESGPYSGPNVLSVDPTPISAGGGVSIGFGAAQLGMGFWYNDSQFAGNSVTVYGTSNRVLGTFELAFPHPTEWLFVGFTSSGNDIARVDVAMGDGDRVTLDNVQFAAAVPEPTSAALLLGGGLALLFLSRRATPLRGRP